MKRKLIITLLFFFVLHFTLAAQRWTAEKASNWYKELSWQVGCNYIPFNAINQLEMWQATTFDSAQISKELSWAKSIGMNTLRVFLHDLLWQQDSTGFIKRLDLFLKICQKHGIRPILVLFDSVWDPEPRLGKQREPRPGVHNSGWVQSPGSASLKDESEHPRLETYVKSIVKVFANDKRILAWDVWNEPDNMNTDNYTEPADKVVLVNKLLPKVFDWCRSAQPMQPLTSGVWITWDGHNWSDSAKWTVTERIQLQQSDIISFHCYSDSATFEKLIQYLLPLGRPLLCTEYLARSYKNTFEAILPLGRKYNVAMINWGFVAGKTQTYLPWDSWKQPYVNGRQPAVWHHEIFYPDGKPYRKEEVELLRRLTGKTTISQ